MDQSPYLQQLMQMAGQPPAPAQPAIDPAMLMQVMQQRKIDGGLPGQPPMPGQAPMAHGLGQSIQNLRQLPQRIGAIPGNVAGNLQQAGQNIQGLPNQLAGLFSLGGR
jgi:hypothetical protein